ncbi:MAG: two-component system response regulator [Desulfobacteraceae bacterium]|nr:two-component system response regulator [Desulfobacteraceae bacterium]
MNFLKKPLVLAVDDTPSNIDVLYRILKNDYEFAAALGGKDALDALDSGIFPDIILLDVVMPDMSGYEVCKNLKKNDKFKDIPVIFITAQYDENDEAKGFEAGASDYIVKPFNTVIVKARIKTHLDLYFISKNLKQQVEDRTADLNKALEKIKEVSLETILRLTNASEYKDEDTGSHIQRMSNYCVAVAKKMGINSNSLEWILYAAPMHDIGKIGIPDRILLKPGKLDSEEWEIMKTHTTIGAKILEGSTAGFIKLGEVIAATHHEKWDGSGYPSGIKGKKIPLVSRIVAIADVFDALTTRRPYKEPFSLEKSFQIIREGSGKHFDPKVVDAFFSVEDEILSIMEKFKDRGETMLMKIRLASGLKEKS